MANINLSHIIAKPFWNVHKSIINNNYSEYFLKGGRGSTKSSFVSIEIIYGIMRDANQSIYSNAIALRKIKDTLHDSVFAQFSWAIEKMGVSHLWEIPKAKLELTYLPTGQKIFFRGADKPKKIKSIKVRKGWIKYIWYEELDEFFGSEEIRVINQSLIRGGDVFSIFYSFNPPKSSRSWVNKEAKTPKLNRLVHHSTYLDIPVPWLGNSFFIEAEHLKKIKKQAYDHEYLGLEVGTGLEVFLNITIREILDDEIKYFDNIRQGVDFGYTIDPVVFERLHYDSTRKKIYIFWEFSGVGISNQKLYKNVSQYQRAYTIADSSDPKSIDELKDLGMTIIGATKGHSSVEYGVKFLSRTIEEIIIDPIRCPRASTEFINYSLEINRNGEIINKYPDKNNHTIDAVRYALEDDMKRTIKPFGHVLGKPKKAIYQ